eukprot:scaffold4.g4754.t1
MYNAGLVLTLVYLYYEDAVVGWVCIAVELALGVAMVVAKFYLDNWGPNSARGLARTRRAPAEAELCTSKSFAHSASVDVRTFLGDAAGLPALFPLLAAPGPSHQAQHLLLDCRLAQPQQQGATARRDLLRDMEAMLAAALSEAGLPARERRLQSFPSFAAAGRRAGRPLQQGGEGPPGGAEGRASSSKTSSSEGPGSDLEAGCEEEEHPHMLFASCRDGYATLMWYASTRTLALDLVAASPEAASSMNAAGHTFCAALAAAFPGSKMAASSLARLPAL